jgi:hypothetical protein
LAVEIAVSALSSLFANSRDARKRSRWMFPQGAVIALAGFCCSGFSGSEEPVVRQLFFNNHLSLLAPNSLALSREATSCYLSSQPACLILQGNLIPSFKSPTKRDPVDALQSAQRGCDYL